MCPLRATFIGAAGDTEASVLKNSAVASGPLAPSPPVIRMRPSESRTADEFARASFRFAVGAHVPVGRILLSIPKPHFARVQGTLAPPESAFSPEMEIPHPSTGHKSRGKIGTVSHKESI